MIKKAENSIKKWFLSILWQEKFSGSLNNVFTNDFSVENLVIMKFCRGERYATVMQTAFDFRWRFANVLS